MCTTVYRIWVRPGKEQFLESVWMDQVDMLYEVGVETGWVVAHNYGECIAYLQWQHCQFWENVRQYCNLMDNVARAMGDNMLGWLSACPSDIVAPGEPAYSEKTQPD